MSAGSFCRSPSRHDVALGNIEAGGHRCGLAVVLAQQHCHQFGDLMAELLQHLGRAVTGPVVDQHQFEALTTGLQGVSELLYQVRQAFFLVVEGHHHGQVQGCGHAAGLLIDAT